MGLADHIRFYLLAPISASGNCAVLPLHICHLVILHLLLLISIINDKFLDTAPTELAINRGERGTLYPCIYTC